MLYNFHTHSNFCDHALGDVREYVEAAIDAGIKELGFSEHAPFTFPDGYKSHYRLQTENEKFYISTLKKIKEEYKKHIKIYIGFEMEYYPRHFKEMFAHAADLGAEYLIQGQHFINNEYPDGMYVSRVTDDETVLFRYVEETIAGIKTKAFTYLAHPDLCNFTGNDELYKKEMAEICRAAKNFNIPLEINLLGIRENRHYPNNIFWEVAGKEQSPVCIGFDAHNPKDLKNADAYITAKEIIKTYSLNEIEKPNLIFINKQ